MQWRPKRNKSFRVHLQKEAQTDLTMTLSGPKSTRNKHLMGEKMKSFGPDAGKLFSCNRDVTKTCAANKEHAQIEGDSVVLNPTYRKRLGESHDALENTSFTEEQEN